VSKGKDKRTAKVTPVSNQVKNFNSRDTRNWCRGKVGVEHRPKWVSRDEAWKHGNAGLSRRQRDLLLIKYTIIQDECTTHREYEICSECGKRLGYQTRRAALPLIDFLQITTDRSGDGWVARTETGLFGVGSSEQKALEALADAVLQRL
jgi:hypothetical protein